MIDDWWKRWRGMSSSLGEKGERYAARWLKRRGYRVIERNYTVGDDEADVIAIAPDGKTVVIVTHDVHEAAYFADRVVMMRDGAIVQQGTVEELLNRPANSFVKEFIEAQQSHLVTSTGGN